MAGTDIALAEETSELGFDPDAVLISPGSGAQAESFGTARLQYPDAALIALTCDRSPRALVELLGSGADRVLVHPLGTIEVRRALTEAVEQRRGETLANSPKSRDPALASALEELDRLALTDASIAISGETGTGKTTLAQRVHRRSARRRQPCVSVFPGHESDEDVFGENGRLARARGGTLLLENLHEAPDRTQERLLAALDGDRQSFRIVSTAERPLVELASRGRLRRDLAYRLGTYELTLPPLRERAEDIPALAARIAERLQLEVAPDDLPHEPWNGNLHELTAWLIRRATGLTAPRETPPPPEPQSLRELERLAIARSLRGNSGNRTRCARQLGISVRTLRNKIRLYGLA
ncbi:MAG: sigma 54-interacting transcriptional regulator [Myxococcales bacterium]|nr:sigma 54-interacting transcriptional regulator [Myxococcales bacterium]